MHRYNGRIRYSEIGSDGKLTDLALLNYFQDGSAFHGEDVGCTLSYLKENNVAWILIFWQICIKKRPSFGEEIFVETRPYKMQGAMGLRNFIMKNKEGDCYAYANSVWGMIDTETGRPIKISEEIKDFYPLDEPIEMDYCSRKIDLPQDYIQQDPFVVPKCFIDTNCHMNNEKYVMLAAENLPKDFFVKEIRVEYRKSALLNDILYQRVTIEEQKITVAITDEQGNLYAIVLFMK